MTWTLPEGTPENLYEAYARLAMLTQPAVDDLRVMLLIEVAGEKIYDTFAAGTDNAAVQQLLRRNGREELGHAHRLSKMVEILSGAPFPVPALADNPLYQPSPPEPLTKDMLHAFAEAEVGGGDLYGRWADHCSNADVAALLRQNGKEETNHAKRLQEAARLLPQ